MKLRKMTEKEKKKTKYRSALRALNTRVAYDKDDERFGFRGKAEYFDCDMNVAKGRNFAQTADKREITLR